MSLECLFVCLSSNAVIGESSLDRLACALGGKTVLSYVLTTVQTMLQNRESSSQRRRKDPILF